MLDALDARTTLIEPAPHAWSGTMPGDGHGCYWCAPERFPAMPPGQTLCACCGAHIAISGDDPMNQAMWVCGPCRDDLEAGDTHE